MFGEINLFDLLKKIKLLFFGKMEIINYIIINLYFFIFGFNFIRFCENGKIILN